MNWYLYFHHSRAAVNCYVQNHLSRMVGFKLYSFGYQGLSFRNAFISSDTQSKMYMYGKIEMT